MERTKPSNATHGASTRAAKKAETTLGGSFCSGWKVWAMGGWGWKDASSGWGAGVADAGT